MLVQVARAKSGSPRRKKSKNTWSSSWQRREAARWGREHSSRWQTRKLQKQHRRGEKRKRKGFCFFVDFVSFLDFGSVSAAQLREARARAGTAGAVLHPNSWQLHVNSSSSSSSKSTEKTEEVIELSE